MFQIHIKYSAKGDNLSRDVLRVFKTQKECYDFMSDFPEDRIIYWSISPILVQTPIAGSHLKTSGHLFRVSFMARAGTQSLGIVPNVHPDNLAKVIMDNVDSLGYDNIYHIRLFFDD